MRGHATRWETLQKCAPVTFGAQARVEYREDAAVSRAADQTSETLLE